MRSRTLTRAVVLAFVGVLALGGTAHGQSEGEGETDSAEISHESEECIEILEAGGEVDDCHEAPSLILPENNEIIWGALAFLVLVAVMGKYAFPPLQKGMANRTDKIREEVEQAERIRDEAAAEETAREDELRQARKEAATHIETARREAEEYRSAEREKIDTELAELRTQGRADVEASKRQALSEIRGEVATLAIAAAEQVVGQNLDRATNERLVEDFIDRVGSDRGAS